ncbi:MAG: SDR family NAD(P)-dependent oxidoreductase [Streptosporangiaceae bacterium]
MAAAKTPRGDLSGQVALVTGGSSGIGRAVSTVLAARGARVTAVGRSLESLDEVAHQAEGITAVPVSLDNADGCAHAVTQARIMGPLTVLVHAAGLGGYLNQPIWQETFQAWRATLAVNLDAAFELTRLAATDMIEARWGRIVMIGSTAGEVGAPAMAAYSASKAGLLGLVRSAAHDLGPYGVTVNAVVPGWVRGTAMAERDAELEAARQGTTVAAVWAERAASSPAGRVLSPADVAGVVSFLVSDSASGISGEAIKVALGGIW